MRKFLQRLLLWHRQIVIVPAAKREEMEPAARGVWHLKLTGDILNISRMKQVALFIALLVFAGAAFAHHGTANYDTTRNITVKGVVTGFDFVNPHVQVFWEVKDDSGVTQKWQGELTSPNRLTRLGWSKNSIKAGDTITVSGYPTKSGSNEIWIQKVVLANGEELPTGGGN